MTAAKYLDTRATAVNRTWASDTMRRLFIVNLLIPIVHISCPQCGLSSGYERAILHMTGLFARIARQLYQLFFVQKLYATVALER